MICLGTGRYSVIGSVVFADGANTGDCPVCHARQPLDLDGIVLSHEADLCGAPMHHQSPAEGTFTAEDIAEARTDPRGECTCEFTPVGPDRYVLPDIDRHCPVHTGELVSPCTLPRGHQEQVEDSGHYDEHGCHADVLVHQSTLREVGHVAREYPDGIHTCAELQRLEPGRRPCTCGRCP